MIKRISAVIVVIVIIAIGVVAYSFLKTPEEASAPIEAIPITAEADESSVAEARITAAEEADTAVEAETRPETADETNAVAEAETQAGAATEGAAAEATNDVKTEVGDDEPSQETASALTTFEIVPAESQARFLIEEVLRGSPITVVGATDQVAGQLAVSSGDLSVTQVGTIQVNARTLATDNDFRNRAIKNQILRTNDYEFVTFAPTEIIGLPETGAVGETYTFQIVGDLSVADVTRPVTFEVVATAQSDTRIEGTATTAFPYTDFELRIPDSPSVDTVDDVVRLELEFVAEDVQQ